MNYLNYGHRTEESKYKAKIRNRKAFKELKERKRKEQGGLDYIMGKKLSKKYNCHHLDQRIENYENLSEDRFVALGLTIHDIVHQLWRYYEKDPTVIDRLKEVLEKMKKYSED
ncbi:MAG: hypothetical protein MJ179_02535 [Treponema sp.]|nr:hypothetical protein [Treponema sp.]